MSFEQSSLAVAGSSEQHAAAAAKVEVAVAVAGSKQQLAGSGWQLECFR